MRVLVLHIFYRKGIAELTEEIDFETEGGYSDLRSVNTQSRLSLCRIRAPSGIVGMYCNGEM